MDGRKRGLTSKQEGQEALRPFPAPLFAIVGRSGAVKGSPCRLMPPLTAPHAPAATSAGSGRL